ncbi:MAG TPA: TadE family protein [Jatrophihabitantaceae bacterium]|jgi:Flp pilus assembly protein TadG
MTTRDRGSLSIEFVIITPMIFLIFALIYVFARVAEVNGVLDTGTRDAARVATQADTYGDAAAAAERVVREEVGTGSQRCLDTLVVDVSKNFEPGQTITVTARCSYPISDAGLPGAPGTLTVSSQFSSVLDPNRTIR